MRNKRKSGFTLIELLVVMAIISALVGILSVGLRKVKIVSTNLKQKGEFHGMEISIELFQNDFNYYPDSTRLYGTSDYVCGAQRLAEAMEGRDEQGFHPRSKWHPDKEAAAGLTLYNNAVVDTSKERKPVYFDLKHSGLHTLEELWGSGATGNLEGQECPVITDVFVRNVPADTTIDGKVGSPVLYFKADPTKPFRVDDSRNPVPVPTANQKWIYNFDDNIDLLNLPWLREPGSPLDLAGMPPHYQARDDYPGATGAELFYKLLTQREDTNTNFYKPYNKDTFILISAGWDGIYGTKDDLTNFSY